MDQPDHDALVTALKEMRTFIARRFDEVSMEVNATSQLLGMAEEGLAGRFSEVMGVLSSITFHGDGTTPHNVGVELDAVVKTTEEAANKIIDSADTISRLVSTPIDWSDEVARNQVLDNISKHADIILLACSFQDITGQRINQTLSNLKKAEEELTDTLKKMGVKVEEATPEQKKKAADLVAPASTQDDIDALFG